MWKNGQSFKGSSNLCSCVYNTLVSNHFHCVKNFVFSSAKPRDFDGLLGTGLLVSMYTTKTQLNYFICIKDFNALTITSLKLNLFYFFIHERKTTCLQTDSGVPNTSIYSAIFLASPHYNYL